MKNLSAIFFLLCFGPLQLSAQVLFANIQQIPIVLTPSNVGSKYGQRIVLAMNSNSNEDYRNSNHAFSYDTFIRKKRLALGAYYWGTDLAYNLAKADYTHYSEEFDHELFRRSLPNKEIAKEGGLCMGIKYNIIDKNNPNTFKASITPAVGISMGGRQIDRYDGFGYVPGTNENDRAQDSLFYRHQMTRGLLWAGQLGVKYNSDRLLLMCHMKFKKEWVSEQQVRWSTSSSSVIHTWGILKHEEVGRFVNNSVENRIAAAYLLRKSKNEKFSLMLYGSAGWIAFLGIPRSRQNTITKNSALIAVQKNAQYAYLASFSALARIHKIVVGGSWSSVQLYSTYGITAGLQFSRFKLITTYFPSIANSRRPTTLEAILSVHIPEQ